MKKNIKIDFILKGINFKFLTVLLLLASLFSQNAHPIFLIHGFLGWGREEMNGYYYWGGKHDFQEKLNDKGYEVFTLSVGPVSSNWDRAIEAYTQIKGGCVDYGKSHSEEFGLIQSPEGKCYEGLYPQWDENNPIHIIGHSQGGLTARMLEYLLTTKFNNESSPLLSTSHSGWIKSITTAATPHDGTTLAPIIMDIFPFAQSMASWIGSIDSDELDKIYNFDLDQWGLTKHNNESNDDFWDSIRNSNLKDSKNFSSWDLSIEGAKAFNSIYTTSSSTYYFTFATYATRQQENSDRHVPDKNMRWLLWPAGLLIGQTEKEDNLWYKNDGIVNTVSMYAPTSGINGPEPAMLFDDNPQMGIWQNIDTFHMDHHRIIGGHVNDEESQKIFEIYLNHCKLLYRLK